MARTRAVKVTRPARLGLAALVVLVLAGIGVYFANYMRGTGGYRIGVHFRQAAGISPGSQVLLNGVVIGGVRKVKILPDTSVDFIIDVFHDRNIPKNAMFSIRSGLTGSPSVVINTPPKMLAANEIWPKRVLPLEQQPVGTEPLSFETFFEQGHALGNRSLAVLNIAHTYGKPLLSHLRRSQSNGAATMQNLRETLPAVTGTLQSTIARAKTNVQDAQAALRERDSAKVPAIAAAFARSSVDMQKTAGALAELKRDPQLRENVRESALQLREVTANMQSLSGNMQSLAANAQTKAELRDASARFHDAAARLRSLLKI